MLVTTKCSNRQCGQSFLVQVSGIVRYVTFECGACGRVYRVDAEGRIEVIGSRFVG